MSSSSISPEHPFWSTPEGRAQEDSSPKGRDSDAVALIWSYPKTNNKPPTGTLTTDFPPDMDAAFFLAVIAIVDAVQGQRVSMTPGLAATLMAMQTASDSALVVAPTAWWLGPLRRYVPYLTQLALESARKLFDKRGAVQVIEDIIDREIVKKD